MAEFVRAQIFGTTFEITSRYVGSCAGGGKPPAEMREGEYHNERTTTEKEMMAMGLCVDGLVNTLADDLFYHIGTRISSPWAWELSASSGMIAPRLPSLLLLLFSHERGRHNEICSDMCVLVQLRKGPVDRPGGRREEDHEAVQHARPVEADVSGTEAVEAPEARECRD